MDKVNTHKDLIVWKKGIELVKLIYKLTKTFPKEELYGITSQLRRASIPTNIAEGAGRRSYKEFSQFLNIALGSCAEVETLLIISIELNLLSENKYLVSVEEIRRMLIGLIKSIRKSYDN